MQGGFRAWVKEGLRVKEPKPETTLIILNEVSLILFIGKREAHSDS